MNFFRALFFISGFLFSVSSTDAFAIAQPTIHNEDGKALFQPGASNRRFCLGIPDDAELTPSLIASAEHFAIDIAPKFKKEFEKCAGDLLGEIAGKWLAENKGSFVYDAIQAQVATATGLLAAMHVGAERNEIETVLVLDFLSKTPQEQEQIEQGFIQQLREKAQILQQLRHDDRYEARTAELERRRLADQVSAFQAMQANIENGDFYAKAAFFLSGSPIYFGRLITCLWANYQQGYVTPEGVYEVRTLSQFLGTTFAAYVFTKLLVRQDALENAKQLTTHAELKKHTRLSVLAKYVTNLAVADTCGFWITGQSLIALTIRSLFEFWKSL